MSIAGRWRIVEMPDYVEDYADMMEPASIEFAADGSANSPSAASPGRSSAGPTAIMSPSPGRATMKWTKSKVMAGPKSSKMAPSPAKSASTTATKLTSSPASGFLQQPVKLARKITGRANIIAFTNGFHGVSIGALSCTGNRYHRAAAGQLLGGVARLPYDGYLGSSVDTADYLDHLLSDPSSGVDAPAAVIVETVQGEGGLNVAGTEWLQKVAAIARKHRALLIVDDIQVGVGRTDSFFSFEAAGLRPDIVTMAKSISGYGLPMALVLIDRQLDRWEPGEHNGTFRGNCHAFVTARAALEQFWRTDSLVASVRAKGNLLKSRLEQIAQKYDPSRASTKGRGMMRGIDLKSGEVAGQVISKAFKRGLIVETSGPKDEVVKCLPPLVIGEDQLSQGLDILEGAIDSVIGSTVNTAA
ncbi:diaminobutyrate--2-oxoglutarate transaminase [Mesorhizobium sp.]|uniref:diaminobutyrate--2-oxoglutarate transaminase n=1 Tax=Mesorhizobium sp. TaxID=1871066 RepID=UPI0025E3D995|nr:diaminobutyrate--2-oxoglutarate transaminase [Mesorhizobium sp.]